YQANKTSDGDGAGRDLSIRAPTHSLAVLLTAGTLVIALAADSANGVPLPKPRPADAPAKAAKSNAAAPPPQAANRPGPVAPAAGEPASPADLAALKDAITAARRGRAAQAGELQQTIGDPAARKLVEWAILRSDETESVALSRYTAFISANP